MLKHEKLEETLPGFLFCFWFLYFIVVVFVLPQSQTKQQQRLDKACCYSGWSFCLAPNTCLKQSTKEHRTGNISDHFKFLKSHPRNQFQVLQGKDRVRTVIIQIKCSLDLCRENNLLLSNVIHLRWPPRSDGNQCHILASY